MEPPICLINMAITAIGRSGAHPKSSHPPPTRKKPAAMPLISARLDPSLKRLATSGPSMAPRPAAAYNQPNVKAPSSPKGNITAVGAKVEIPVSRLGRLVPKVEYRRLAEAPRDETGDGSLESAGSSFRVGADFKLPLGSAVALVLEGNGLFGDVRTAEGVDAGVSGFRGGLHLQIRR